VHDVHRHMDILRIRGVKQIFGSDLVQVEHISCSCGSFTFLGVMHVVQRSMATLRIRGAKQVSGSDLVQVEHASC